MFPLLDQIILPIQKHVHRVRDRHGHHDRRGHHDHRDHHDLLSHRDLIHLRDVHVLRDLRDRLDRLVRHGHQKLILL